MYDGLIGVCNFGLSAPSAARLDRITDISAYNIMGYTIIMHYINVEILKRLHVLSVPININKCI